MTKNNIKIIASCFMALLLPGLMLGNDLNNGVVSAETSSNMDVMLCIVTIILLLPLYISTRTFMAVAKGAIAKKKESNTATKAIATLLLFFFTQTGFAQAVDAASKMPASSDVFPDNSLTWMLVIIILLESILIVLFSAMTNNLMRKTTEKTVPLADICPEVVAEKGFFKNLWERMNSFKPLAEEAEIDTGHSYDGIRELNNITPPWFAFAFVASIIFAAVYLYVYHVAKSSPSQVEEYNIEMADAEKAKAKMLAIQGNNVDESNVTMLGTDDIANGKKIFSEKCAACHQSHGGSMAGGVGPNLTDDYWLHGGSIKDIFKSVKYGWVEKGMISWKDQLSAKEIAQISSFIRSIKGSNPAGAKEPQGELYTESATKSVKDSTATDSIKVKK